MTEFEHGTKFNIDATYDVRTEKFDHLIMGRVCFIFVSLKTKVIISAFEQHFSEICTQSSGH